MYENSEGGGSSEELYVELIRITLKLVVMNICSFVHTVLSFLGIFYCLLMILGPEFMDVAKSQEILEAERKRRALEPSNKPKCGATALRLNLDLNRLHGKWYPIEASDSAYVLWMTSLYGKTEKNSDIAVIPDCIVLNFEPGPEEQTLNIELEHRKKSITVQAALLADAVHPGTSKWVVSWPNGEDTLTSIVATGSVNSENRYDWMLTVDCDLNGSVSADWAIFSREDGLSPEATGAIKGILNGIEGLRQSQGRQMMEPRNCTSN